MMARTLLLIVAIFYTLTLSNCAAQNDKAQKYLQKAEKQAQNGASEKAILSYNKAIKADPTNSLAYEKLAVLLFRNGQPKEGIKILEKMVLQAENYNPEALFKLGESYFQQKEYSSALDFYNRYLQHSSARPKLVQEAKQKSIMLSRMKERTEVDVNFRPLNTNINTDAHEYFPVLPSDENTLLFTRRKGMQEDFYLSHMDTNGWGEALFVNALNSPFRDGGACFSADGKLVFITRCGDRRTGYGSCDIYIANYQDDISKPRNLGPTINSSAKETQPALSPDGSTLYFASNRPGGHGGMDIWKSVYSAKGGWSNPIPLDTPINTPYNEKTPFVHLDGKTLYFASDRPGGFGEEDLYKASLSGAPEVKNLDYPINTPDFEASIFVAPDGYTAYMGRRIDGDFDLFQFELPKEAQAHPSTYIYGTLLNKINNKPISAQVEVFQNGKLLTNVTSDQSGAFFLPIQKGESYEFFVDRAGFFHYSEQISIDDLSAYKKGKKVILYLIPESDTSMLEKDVVLENVYFETGSDEILPDAIPELKKLANLLIKHEEWTAEIRAYTDNVGSAQSNQILSMNRAESVVNKLIELGVPQDRLEWKGYGEANPIGNNDTEEGRRLNRRTTFFLKKSN